MEKTKDFSQSIKFGGGDKKYITSSKDTLPSKEFPCKNKKLQCRGSHE
jgi:hypothetical protein